MIGGGFESMKSDESAVQRTEGAEKGFETRKTQKARKTQKISADKCKFRVIINVI